jgi:hypothetical protein
MFHKALNNKLKKIVGSLFLVIGCPGAEPCFPEIGKSRVGQAACSRANMRMRRSKRGMNTIVRAGT